MSSNLHIIFFLTSFIIKRLKKLFMSCFAMSYIIVYNVIIIPDILDKVDNSIKVGIVKH